MNNNPNEFHNLLGTLNLEHLEAVFNYVKAGTGTELAEFFKEASEIQLEPSDDESEV